MNEKAKLKANHLLRKKSIVIFLSLSAIYLIFINLAIVWRTTTVIFETRDLLVPRDRSTPLTSPENLLLSDKDLPDDWEIGTEMEVPQDYFQYTGDARGRWYRHPANIGFKQSPPAYHVIGRYGSIEVAEREINSLRSGFSSGQYVGWTFESHADDFLYNCVIREGVRGGAVECEFVMRYGEYVSYLVIVPEYTEVDSEGIATILTTLDQKFLAIEISR